MKLPQARKEKLTVRELPEETLVYDSLRHKSHCLNRTAALVWQHCDGRTTIAEMAAILHEELDLPADQHIVRLALEQLSRRQLLQEEIAPLSAKARITRRDALKKIAVAAAALPVVMTLTAKTARVNASASPPAGKICFGDGDCSVSGPCQTAQCVGATLPGSEGFPRPGVCRYGVANGGTPCPGGVCDNGKCVACTSTGQQVATCVNGKSSQCCSGNCALSGQVCICL